MARVFLYERHGRALLYSPAYRGVSQPMGANVPLVPIRVPVQARAGGRLSDVSSYLDSPHADKRLSAAGA